MQPLTDKQEKVLLFLRERLSEGNPPSQREVANHFGISQNAVCQLVRYLKEKGYLVAESGHRGLRLSRAFEAVAQEAEGSHGRGQGQAPFDKGAPELDADGLARQAGIPVVGRVAAGEPILAEQNIDEYLDAETFFGLEAGTFCLRVAGDSMVDEGIMDGDYVIVRPGETVEHEEVAVVMVGDDATVKRVLLYGDRIGLKPANQAAGYQIRYFSEGSDQVRIVGKVVGCFRRLA